jgi:hypothetical protein
VPEVSTPFRAALSGVCICGGNIILPEKIVHCVGWSYAMRRIKVDMVERREQDSEYAVW